MKNPSVANKTMGLIVAAFLAQPVGAALLIWWADGTERGSFADAKIISIRVILSVLLFMAMLVPFFWVANRRAPGADLTWGEAMIAASYVFFMLFWLYGVIPHEFLNWADSELSWRPDRKVIGPEGTWGEWWGFWNQIPLTVHKQTIRDLIAVNLYVVGLVMFVRGCSFWNSRAAVAAEVAAIEPVSAYGRPLVAKAKG